MTLKSYGQLLEPVDSLQLASSKKFVSSVIQKWILPTTWMNLEVVSSPVEPPDEENSSIETLPAACENPRQYPLNSVQTPDPRHNKLWNKRCVCIVLSCQISGNLLYSNRKFMLIIFLSVQIWVFKSWHVIMFTESESNRNISKYLFSKCSIQNKNFLCKSPLLQKQA